jgi:hypothetical protein
MKTSVLIVTTAFCALFLAWLVWCREYDKEVNEDSPLNPAYSVTLK